MEKAKDGLPQVCLPYGYRKHNWGQSLLPYQLHRSKEVEERGQDIVIKWPVKVQWPLLMVRKGHRHSPSTGRCSFQYLSEENIYAWQPTDARGSTAPAVRSEIRNSLSLRLIPLFASACGISYPKVGIFGFSESSIPACQPLPLLMPNFL